MEGAKQDARHEAEGLYAAVKRHDGEAAGARLAEPTAQALEREEKEPCAKAVTSLDLKLAGVTAVRVYETSAAVTLASGEITYLDRTDQGWKVSAAGCKPQGEEPADCELED